MKRLDSIKESPEKKSWENCTYLEKMFSITLSHLVTVYFNFIIFIAVKSL